MSLPVGKSSSLQKERFSILPCFDVANSLCKSYHEIRAEGEVSMILNKIMHAAFPQRTESLASPCVTAHHEMMELAETLPMKLLQA